MRTRALDCGGGNLQAVSDNLVVELADPRIETSSVGVSRVYSPPGQSGEVSLIFKCTLRITVCCYYALEKMKKRIHDYKKLSISSTHNPTTHPYPYFLFFSVRPPVLNQRVVFCASVIVLRSLSGGSGRPSSPAVYSQSSVRQPPHLLQCLW